MSEIDRPSIRISLIAIFAALDTVLTLIPGPWRSWVIIVEASVGIILGPYIGGLAILIGSLLGHFYREGAGLMLLFGLGEPIGAMSAGFLYRKRYKETIILYTVFLVGYLLTPISWQLPLWALWDTILAYALIFVLIAFTKYIKIENLRFKELITLGLIGFIASGIDVMFRIFVLITLHVYVIWGLTVPVLQSLWISGALLTPIEDLISTIATITIAPSILYAMKSIGILQET